MMAQQIALPESETARRLEATKVISLGFTIATAIVLIAATIIWAINRSYSLLPTDLCIGASVITCLVSYLLARAGKAWAAAGLLVIGFLLEFPPITVMFGGATGPACILYVFPILISGIVIGIVYGFVAATLVSIGYLVMIPIEGAGILPQVIPSVSNGTINPIFVASWIVTFFAIAYLGWYATSRLNSALQEVRRFAGELQTANEKLQASEEELRASNEELSASNEELRATEEELRASNEELRVTNEELKEAQDRLIRTEKLAAIGQLAGGVGHELRNPLGAIKNAVYYIRSKVSKSELSQHEPRLMEFLNIVDDEINSSNKIINDLLSFSRVGKPAVSPSHIEAVINDAISHTPIPENVALSKNIVPNLPEIQIDTDQIRQVLVNIMTNAVQAMPDGGKLSLSAREKDGLMEISVGDTGTGIPQEIIGKIFDPLYTTKAKGIGLGLAVCKSIIERHEGRIDVASKVGEGTTFTIKLPLKAK